MMGFLFGGALVLIIAIIGMVATIGVLFHSDCSLFTKVATGISGVLGCAGALTFSIVLFFNAIAAHVQVVCGH